MRPSILIADDHRVFAESLSSMLGSAYETVGIAANGREFVDLALRHKPALILTDVSMPLLNGIDAVHTLREKGLHSKFVVLTMHVDVSLAVLVFRAGASAFVVKSASLDEVKEALQVVLRGGCYLSPQFPCDLVTVLAEAAHRPMHNDNPQLTRRQREVLQLVAEGKTMKEVASHLNISARTAESYKYHLMSVLGVRTTAELVQYAIKIGLITIPPFSNVA